MTMGAKRITNPRVPSPEQGVWHVVPFSAAGTARSPLLQRKCGACGMKVGEACGGDALSDTKFPCSSTTFVDLHKTQRDVSMLEGSGKSGCKATCLQRYGCGGKEIARFYVTRNFKAVEFTDGSNKVHVTSGSIVKEPASP